MEGTEDQARLNADLSGYFKTRADYQWVTVLVLYWQECSISGFKEEGAKIGALFSGDFGFKIEYFEIPSSDSQFALKQRLHELLATNRRENNLLIIHYGGHGDDDEDHKRQSVWASESDDQAPMLRWSEVQPNLKDHRSDVLLLLDCCYASQAARDSKSPVPENVELFAACGLNNKTVLPGPYSFTSLLVQEIKDSLISDGCVKISDVHSNLASKESKLAQSALYYPLRGVKASITLRPLVASSDRSVPMLPEIGSITLRISLAKLEQDALDEIVRWLKVNPPQTISNVKIEQLRTSATAVNDYINANSRGKTVATFSQFSVPARDDVAWAWTTFNQSITRMASYLRGNPPNVTLIDDSSEKTLSTVYAKELAESFDPVKKAIERNIMAIPELSEKEELLDATKDQQLAALGLGEMLKLRVLAHFAPESDQMELNISISQSIGPFPSRTIDTLSDMPQLGRMLIEAKKFDESMDQRGFEAAKTRLQNLSSLLQSSKSADFHSLTCQGFFFEPRQAYGLIFRIPPGARKLPISLREILSREIRVRKPTLGQRFQIAHKIGTAILKWHLVNWVHQGIASYNIVFFYNEVEGVDYSNPYLCGFEYSRKNSAPSTSRIVEQFELNVYRHPDRQGVPSASHQKEHDIYSYGILLLELGLWDLVENLFNSKEKKGGISPSDMGKRIRDAARRELGHYAGAAYQRAASTCLSGSFGVEEDDRVNSRMAKAFETQVLTEIKRGIVVD
ncbi:hypothetical protein N431DRAFT_477922 [Stipitochalara longipes BDJ]|nr:hypothetical protein N431DRAFT_477922 [Stipitochalara longipes BDJ]